MDYTLCPEWCPAVMSAMARCVMGLLQDLAQVLRGSGSGLETLRPGLGLPGLEKLVVFYPACQLRTRSLQP